VLTADGERLDLGLSDVREHRRVLDMRRGTLCRSFLWRTRSGALLEVRFARLVSLAHTELAALSLELTCREGACALRLESALAPAVIAEGDPNDPRNAAGKDRSLARGRLFAEGSLLAMEQKTKNSGYTIACAVQHRGLEGQSETKEKSAVWAFPSTEGRTFWRIS
jgi:alpha,alpha-trehalose phosphorylase